MQPRASMDHDHYAPSMLEQRDRFRWPGGMPVALQVLVYLEHWELQGPEGHVQAPGVQGHWNSFFPDTRTLTHREYGHRIGIFRVLELLDHFGIRATVPANAAALERYPFLVEALASRGYEFVGHGLTANRMASSRLTRDEEESMIHRAIDVQVAVLGQQPRGWISQDFGESEQTPALLAAAGFDWLSDWPNDDQPYYLHHHCKRPAAGRPADPASLDQLPLVSLPYHADLDDVQLLWLRQQRTSDFPRAMREALDVLVQDGQHTARMLTLAVHPWLLGQPHRIGALRQVLDDVARRNTIWQPTSSDLVDAFRAAMPWSATQRRNEDEPDRQIHDNR